MKTLFDNYSVDYAELARQDIEQELEKNETLNPDENDMDAEWVQDRAYDYQNDDWQDMLKTVKELVDNHSNDWKITGYFGCWDGKHEKECKLSMFKNVSDFINQCVDDCDTERIILDDEEGCLKINSWHHDGMNEFKMYPMTKQGGVTTGYVKQFIKQNLA